MSFIATAVVVGVGAAAGAAYLSAGDKPKMPGVPQIDPTGVQRDTIAGNLENVPGAAKLASRVNSANQTELNRMREGTLPGGMDMVRGIINDQLKGEADVADVQSAIRQTVAAGFGLGAGGGSQFTKFGVVGHLGRSVAQQKQQGISNFIGFSGFAEAPKFNFASMFLSATDRLKITMEQNKMNYDASVAQAAIDAQPSKGAMAAAGGLSALSSFATMGAGSMAGGGSFLGMGGAKAAGSGSRVGSGLEYGNVGFLTTPRAGVGDSGYNSTVMPFDMTRMAKYDNGQYQGGWANGSSPGGWA